ncbi:MAG: DUF459 domain-containing protein [Actinobacteria bacterium]|nr:DUF459 domain-containing protein [Actinomycetota bacterium]
MSRGEHQTSSGVGGHRAGPQYQSGIRRFQDHETPSASSPGLAQDPSAEPSEEPELSRSPESSTGNNNKPGAMPAGKALFAGLLALLLAMVLNADQLVRDAQRKEFGSGRDISLAVWEPVASFADTLGLNEARSWADQALGREYGDVSAVFTVEATNTQSVEPDGATTPSSGAIDEIGPSSNTSTIPVTSNSSQPETSEPNTTTVIVSTTTTTTTATTTQSRRALSLETPLRLWVGGDSMAQVFGQSLVRLAADFEVIESTLDFRISTGLTRPDFFNWPAYFADITAEDNPEVMVVIFGANDAQGMALSTGVFQPFDDEWVAEYTSRVGFVMNLLTTDSDRVVLWVGQPRMRSDEFDAKMQTLNGIYQSEAERFEQVIYLDTVPLFSAVDGTYDAFLPALGGEIRNLRQQDGTHLSRAGGDLLADAVLDRVGEDIDLTNPTTTTSITTSTVDSSRVTVDGTPSGTDE